MHLSIDAVERQFDLLAALTQGRPSASAGIPTDSGFAASLLILREFMHHLQFSAITITSP
jgi:NADH:ubiquinone oxidoreductase subunit 4 (subunit M)